MKIGLKNGFFSWKYLVVMWKSHTFAFAFRKYSSNKLLNKLKGC